MKIASRIGNQLLAVTFLLSGAITLGSLSLADAQTPIKIGIISPTFGHAPFYIAREKGFYKAEGLIGEVIVMNRDDLILQGESRQGRDVAADGYPSLTLSAR